MNNRRKPLALFLAYVLLVTTASAQTVPAPAQPQGGGAAPQAPATTTAPGSTVPQQPAAGSTSQAGAPSAAPVGSTSPIGMNTGLPAPSKEAVGQAKKEVPYTPSIQVDKPQTFFFRSYQGTVVPPVQTGNAPRIQSLIRAGNLYLTVQDAIALALENNIDIEINRYNPLIADWQVQRNEAGGALRGVTNSVQNIGAVASGQGVAGTQSSSGGSSGGSNSNTAGGATVSQIGPVTPNLDLFLQDAATFSHQTSPQIRTTLSGTSTALVDVSRIYQTSLQQGYLLGGSATLTYKNSFLDENSPTNALNPSVAPSLNLQVQQNLLQGFGTAVNGRFIKASQNSLIASNLNFKGTVIDIVANVLNLYWGLASDYEDLDAKKSALALAQKLYSDNKKQVDIGTLAPIEITRAEAQVSSSERDLTVSETNLLQQEVQLKNIISRNGLADPILASARIIPLDHIDVPDQLNIGPTPQLIAQAKTNRADLAAERLTAANSVIDNLGTRNGILPTLEAIGSLTNAGLAGRENLQAEQAIGMTPGQLKYFNGGVGTGLGQVFRRNFPSERGTVFFANTFRNRTAQADYAIGELQYQQQQLTIQSDFNQLGVDVSNQIIALRQAHIRYKAAVKNRILQEQILAAEEKKLELGTSTTYMVVQYQRDLATARSNEVTARSNFEQAKVGLDRVLGTTLETNNITLDEARSGRVARPPTTPPANPPQLP